MVKINVPYLRRIRIESDQLAGHMLTVHDADTGETIDHVKAVTVYLSATGINEADVTYYETDETGKIIVEDGKPVEKTVTTSNPVIDVIAMERLHEPTDATEEDSTQAD